MGTRNSKGQFTKGNNFVIERKSKSDINADRVVTFVEQVLCEVVTIDCYPNGDTPKKPVKMPVYEWARLVQTQLVMYGFFYRPDGKGVVSYTNPDDKDYLNFIQKNYFNAYDRLTVSDVKLIMQYGREGLDDNERLTFVTNIIKNSPSINSLIDVLIEKFSMRGWQREFVDRTEDILMARGGRGRGGTSAALPMTLVKTVKHIGLTTKAYRLYRTTTRISQFAGLLSIINNNPFMHLLVTSMNKTKMTIDFTNGSKIICGGLGDDTQAEQTKGTSSETGLGSGDSLAFIDETKDIPKDRFYTVLSNMRGDKLKPNPQLILATNPATPKHYLYTDIIDNEIKDTTLHGGMIKEVVLDGVNKLRVADYNKTALDNEALMEVDPTYYDRLGILKGVQRLRDQNGEWVLAEGAIYTAYDPKIHLIDLPQSKIDEILESGNYELFIGGDWGSTDATAIMFNLVKNDTKTIGTEQVVDPTFFLYKQIYIWGCQRSKIPEVVSEFLSPMELKRFVRFIGGHDGVSEIDGLNTLKISAIPNRGRPTVNENYFKRYPHYLMQGFDKNSTVSTVNSLFADNKLFIARNGVIHHSKLNKLKLLNWTEPKPSQPTSWQDEIPEIQWATVSKNGENVTKDEIKDGNDHANDAQLNVVHYVLQTYTRLLEKNIQKTFESIRKSLEGVI